MTTRPPFTPSPLHPFTPSLFTPAFDQLLRDLPRPLELQFVRASEAGAEKFRAAAVSALVEAQTLAAAEAAAAAGLASGDGDGGAAERRLAARECAQCRLVFFNERAVGLELETDFYHEFTVVKRVVPGGEASRLPAPLWGWEGGGGGGGGGGGRVAQVIEL